MIGKKSLNIPFSMTMATRKISSAIDLHTHMYLPKYMDILRSRSDVPYVRSIDGINRLVILPGEDKEKSTSIGR